MINISVVKALGPVLAAVMLAGRVGGALTAELGTMNVTEQIDAVRSMGTDPMRYLVAPRFLACELLTPFLIIYADLMGILGGAVVGIGAFDITPSQYFEQTRGVMEMGHFLIGVVKSIVFGVIIALAGCQKGMACGRSATEVGYAATSAVVTAIVIIIAVDGLFAVITNVLGV